MPAKRENLIARDALFTVKRDGVVHVIAENYFYKTESYYTILRHELKGEEVAPGSSAVLDAYVVPICLERARLAGIPTAEWGISHSYVPCPSIVYGLNYFATSSEFFVVKDPGCGRGIVKHVTNKGKYPFCYQNLEEDSMVRTVASVFGRIEASDEVIAGYAEKIYGAFRIPLLNLVFIEEKGSFSLSSLTPVKYTQLSAGEKSLLQAYLSSQEFL